MRVALFSCSFVDYTLELANALSRYVQVLVVFPGWLNPSYRKLLKSQVTPLFERNLRLYDPRNLYESLKIIRQVDRFQPDILHFQTGDLWYIPWLPYLRYKYPIVNTIHDVVLHKGEYRFYREAILYPLRKSSQHIIVHGKRLRAMAVPRYKMPEDRVHSIPIGLHSLYTAWQQPLVNEERDTVLFFGRIKKYKGLDVLIEAEPLISERVPGLKIIIAGTGDDFAPYEKKMKDRQRFEVHNYRIPPQETAELFQRASLVVLPYIDGSQSAVVPIAYAFKKPVVVTRVGSIPEAVPDGVAGFVVPPGDVPHLAEAIIRLLLDEELRRRMGEGAWHFANTQLSWDSIARKTVSIYEEALMAKGQPH